MTKALIVDDEPRALNLLKVIMERNFPEEFLLKTALGGEEAMQMIPEFQPDLLFLDIEMPNIGGFDLLARCTNTKCSVIFTTAYNQYAIRAIRYNALDYLLKPVDPKELAAAVLRFKTRGEQRSNYDRQVSNLLKKTEKHLAITTYDGVVFLEVDNIIRCEADLNYTRFILADSKVFVSSKTLKEYEDLLSVHKHFLRIHRSHLVNLNYVLRYRHEGNLVLKDNSIIPVARRKKEEVVQTLGKMLS